MHVKRQSGLSGLARRYLGAPRAQVTSLAETSHRAFERPDAPWVHGQSWTNLLFAHWRVPADVLRGHIPDGLELETFDGSAWLGVTPFMLESLRARFTLPTPLLSNFPELNIRTYVTHRGKPGIWFFSLNTPNLLAAGAARLTYRLPYMVCDLKVAADDGRQLVTVAGRGIGGNPGGAVNLQYRPTGQPAPAKQGLESFLTERYCLYTTTGDGTLMCADIHHGPWMLQPAKLLKQRVDPSCLPDGILLDGAPLVHFSARQDVVVWKLGRAG